MATVKTSNGMDIEAYKRSILEKAGLPARLLDQSYANSLQTKLTANGNTTSALQNGSTHFGNSDCRSNNNNYSGILDHENGQSHRIQNQSAFDYNEQYDSRTLQRANCGEFVQNLELRRSPNANGSSGYNRTGYNCSASLPSSDDQLSSSTASTCRCETGSNSSSSSSSLSNPEEATSAQSLQQKKTALVNELQAKSTVELSSSSSTNGSLKHYQNHAFVNDNTNGIGNNFSASAAFSNGNHLAEFAENEKHKANNGSSEVIERDLNHGTRNGFTTQSATIYSSSSAKTTFAQQNLPADDELSLNQYVGNGNNSCLHSQTKECPTALLDNIAEVAAEKIDSLLQLQRQVSVASKADETKTQNGRDEKDSISVSSPITSSTLATDVSCDSAYRANSASPLRLTNREESRGITDEHEPDYDWLTVKTVLSPNRLPLDEYRSSQNNYSVQSPNSDFSSTFDKYSSAKSLNGQEPSAALLETWEEILCSVPEPPPPPTNSFRSQISSSIMPTIKEELNELPHQPLLELRSSGFGSTASLTDDRTHSGLSEYNYSRPLKVELLQKDTLHETTLKESDDARASNSEVTNSKKHLSSNGFEEIHPRNAEKICESKTHNSNDSAKQDHVGAMPGSVSDKVKEFSAIIKNESAIPVPVAPSSKRPSSATFSRSSSARSSATTSASAPDQFPSLRRQTASSIAKPDLIESPQARLPPKVSAPPPPPPKPTVVHSAESMALPANTTTSYSYYSSQNSFQPPSPSSDAWQTSHPRHYSAETLSPRATNNISSAPVNASGQSNGVPDWAGPRSPSSPPSFWHLRSYGGPTANETKPSSLENRGSAPQPQLSPLNRTWHSPTNCDYNANNNAMSTVDTPTTVSKQQTSVKQQSPLRRMPSPPFYELNKSQPRQRLLSPDATDSQVKPREFEQARRSAIKEQLPRSARFNDWRLGNEEEKDNNPSLVHWLNSESLPPPPPAFAAADSQHASKSTPPWIASPRPAAAAFDAESSGRNAADASNRQPTESTNQFGIKSEQRKPEPSSNFISPVRFPSVNLPGTGRLRNLWEGRINESQQQQPKQAKSVQRSKSTDRSGTSSFPLSCGQTHGFKNQSLDRRKSYQTSEGATTGPSQNRDSLIAENYSSSKSPQVFGQQPATSSLLLQTKPTDRLSFGPTVSVDNESKQLNGDSRMPRPIIQVPGNKWFDPSKAHVTVSHESIGNSGSTKNRWEQIVADEQRDLASVVPPPTIQRFRAVNTGSYYPPNEPLMHTTAMHRRTTVTESRAGGGRSPDYSPRPTGVSHESRWSSMRRGRSKSPQTRPSFGAEVRAGLNVIEREINEYTAKEHQLQTGGGVMGSKYGNRARSQERSRHGRMDSSPDSEEGFDRESELLAIYCQSKPEVFRKLGIELPPHLKTRSRTPTAQMPKVELHAIGTNGSAATNGRASRYDDSPTTTDYYSQSPSHHSTLERSSSRHGGRYLKNPSRQGSRIAGGGAGGRHISSRRASPDRGDNKPAEPLPIEQSDPGFNAFRRKSSENLIAMEIMSQEQKEKDWRRSRSQLGLPKNLDDVMYNWQTKGGAYGGNLRNAQSYDHLAHAAEESEYRHSSKPDYPLELSTSMDHLHHHAARGSQYAPGRHKPRSRSPGSPGGYGREPLSHQNGYHQQYKGPSSHSFQSTQHSSYQIKPSSRQGSRMHSPGSYKGKTVSAGAKSYENLVQLANSDEASVIKIGSQGTQRVEYVPVETRIEQEVQELKRREDELRRQRAHPIIPSMAPPLLQNLPPPVESEGGSEVDTFSTGGSFAGNRFKQQDYSSSDHNSLAMVPYGMDEQNKNESAGSDDGANDTGSLKASNGRYNGYARLTAR